MSQHARRFSGDIGKSYGKDDDVEVPPLINEAQTHANYWRHVVGMAEDAAAIEEDLSSIDELPGEQTAIMAYHQWVLEYYNRLRDYAGQIQRPDALKWWRERPIAIRTWRGHPEIVVTVRAGALDLLTEILDRDDEVAIGSRVTLSEFVGLQSLIFARRLESRVSVDVGTARNPGKREEHVVPDWLDAETLMACHDGLSAITADLGFVPRASTVRIEDPGTLSHE